LRVDVQGGASCHVGYRSCFYRSVPFGEKRGSSVLKFEENEKGSIEVGKSADFIILDNDIIRSAENRIPYTNTVATFIDGELVFNRRYN